MDFKLLAFEDKEIFDFYFKQYNPEISEYTFTNLYVFSNSRQIEYCIYQNTLILYAISAIIITEQNIINNPKLCTLGEKIRLCMKT